MRTGQYSIAGMFETESTDKSNPEGLIARNRPRFMAYVAICEVVEGIEAKIQGHHAMEALHPSNVMLSLGAAALTTAVYDKLRAKGLMGRR